MIINLVKNALKFTTEGKIEIKATFIIDELNLKESMLQIDISDTGVGIAEEDICKLFTQFGKL